MNLSKSGWEKDIWTVYKRNAREGRRRKDLELVGHRRFEDLDLGIIICCT